MQRHLIEKEDGRSAFEQMKIFDCFTFFNDLELLELRLMTLNDVVDYFVLVESDRTLVWNKKDFIFEKNKHLYEKYLDKIIYVKVEDSPVFDASKNIWSIENFQRNCITRGLTNAKDEDRIMISDIDEIANPSKIKEAKESNGPVVFNQRLFYYFINCMSTKRSWNGPVMVPFKGMPSPQELRNTKRRFPKIINGGWHYTYMGGLERIRLKLNNLNDAFKRIDQIGTDEDILRKMNTQKDLWDENQAHLLIDIDEENYAPKCIKKFIEKYPSFYFKQN